MWPDFVEAVKFFGGLTGLASGAFLIYDRLFRNQPTVFLVAHKFTAALCIKNTSAETIVVEGIDIEPPIISVNRANDLRSTSQERQSVWYPKENDEDAMSVFLLLKPEAERTFQIHRSADFEKADEEATISLRCRWRNTRRPLPIIRSVWLKVYVKDIRALRAASLAGKA